MTRNGPETKLCYNPEMTEPGKIRILIANALVMDIQMPVLEGYPANP